MKSDTVRLCPACGKPFQGETHADCPLAGPTVRVEDEARAPARPALRGEEALPEEARIAAAQDGARLNQYVLVRQVGRGGMGTVWRAWDTALARWAAIKFLHGSGEEDVQRFRREARLAAGLHHPNIAAVYEVGEAPAAHAGASPAPYLVMQFIDGRPLGEAGLAPEALAAALALVADAIEAAHRSGVIHRDLKPQNILVTADGKPYVMDFGLAKAVQADSSLSVTGTVMGTPAFMAPEQAAGRSGEVDASSDVYSLGATLYAVACGRPPYQGDTAMNLLLRVLREPPPRPRAIAPELPEALERVILRAMARRKEDRYPSAAALAEDLRRFAAARPVEARPAAARGRGTAWAVVSAIGIACAGAWIAWAPRSEPSSAAASGSTPPARAGIAEQPRTFRLRVYVQGARVAALRREGRPLPLPPDPDTPFAADVEVGRYEVDLEHPSGTRKTAVVSGGAPGQTVTVLGDIRAPRVLVD